MNTTIQIRIDASTKTRAQKMFKEMGLDLSSGIKFLLARESNPKNVTYICPFGFMHRYTPEMLEKFEQETEAVLKKGKGYTSTKKMFKDIMAGK